MRGIIEFGIKRPLFVNLLSVFILVAGVISIFSLKKEAFPPVNFNTVIITTVFRGASPEKVEQLVTIPIEKELKNVSDIKRITSSSVEGLSQIAVEISQDVKDVDKVVRDIQKAVDRVSGLPEDVLDRPVVQEITAGEFPVLQVVLYGDLEELKLNLLAEELKDRLEDLPEVASVVEYGKRDEEYWVVLDPEKMQKMHISFSAIARALAEQNVDLPGGKFDYDGKEYAVKIKADLKDGKDIEETSVRGQDIGPVIKVKDVARVVFTLQEPTVLARINGKKGILLSVKKKDRADILSAVKHIEETLAAFRAKAPEGLSVEPYDDLSYYVRRRLNVLTNNGIFGFIFVICVLFFFLPKTSAVFTALGIPLSLSVALFIMYLNGISINLVTMFGLIMVLGIIVDDGIIISENVFRHIEAGKPPRQAALEGASEVALPVVATVLTTIVAFLPLMFMGGTLGKFVRNIPLVVIIALVASLLEALFVLPSHLAEYARPLNKSKRQNTKKAFDRVLDAYTRVLRAVLKRRWLFFFVVFFSFIALLWVGVKTIPFELFPSRASEAAYIEVEMADSISLAKASEVVHNIEKIVEGLDEKYLDVFQTTIWVAFAQITIYLTPYNKRDKTSMEIVNELRPKLKAFQERYKDTGLIKNITAASIKDGPRVGRAVHVSVRGESFETILEITDKIKRYLASIDGVLNVNDTYRLSGEEFRVMIDEEKARRAGLSNADISYAIRSAFAGVIATDIKQEKADDEINVLVRYDINERNTKDVLEKILVENRQGYLVPLKNVIKVEKGKSIKSINHLNGKREVSVVADVDPKKITSLKVGNMIAERFKDIPNEYPGYSIEFLGENEESKASLLDLLKAFFISLLLIFLILATQFNSLIQPFIVMTSIPFSLTGVVIGFLFHNLGRLFGNVQGEPFSFLGIMGIVGLTGIVVNDAIVLVDFINKRRQSGPLLDAVVEAGRVRFRPVLLTTITTVVGLGTVAYGIGGLDPFLRPMALSISWGLLFATGLTLILVPAIYLIIEDIKCKMFKVCNIKQFEV